MECVFSRDNFSTQCLSLFGIGIVQWGQDTENVFLELLS